MENNNQHNPFVEDENPMEKNTEEEINIILEEKQTKKKISPVLKELYEWTQAIAIAVVVAILINQYVFAIVEVNGSSMLPTLRNEERLFVRKLFYKPKNKDIVILDSDKMGKFLVKRVIAVEGQTIDINEETGDVFVDGEVLDEPYISEKLVSGGNAVKYPLTIPSGSVFVMGDNRNNSSDSRMLGLIDEKDVLGKATLRLWPFDVFGGLYDNLE